MKKLTIFLLFSIFFSNSNAQNPVSFVDVVNVEGASQGELYQRLAEWSEKQFVAKDDEVSYDSTAGRIVAKSKIDYIQTANMNINQFSCSIAYVLTVEVKDGRYRYDLGRFDHSSQYYIGTQLFNLGVLTDQQPAPLGGKKSGAPITKKLYNYAIEKVNEKADAVIASLKQAMTTTSAEPAEW